MVVLPSIVTTKALDTTSSNMVTDGLPTMAKEDYRALLTDREIEILKREAGVSDKYYYRVVSRVRDKIERLEADMEILDDNHDTLGEELRETVCGGLYKDNTGGNDGC